MRGATRAHQQKLEEADLRFVFAGLNAMGRVPWKVNRGVLDVVEGVMAAPDAFPLPFWDMESVLAAARLQHPGKEGDDNRTNARLQAKRRRFVQEHLRHYQQHAPAHKASLG